MSPTSVRTSYTVVRTVLTNDFVTRSSICIFMGAPINYCYLRVAVGAVKLPLGFNSYTIVIDGEFVC